MLTLLAMLTLWLLIIETIWDKAKVYWSNLENVNQLLLIMGLRDASASKKGKCCETFSFDWMKDAAEYSSEVAWLNKPYRNNQGSADELQKGKSETRVCTIVRHERWKIKTSADLKVHLLIFRRLGSESRMDFEQKAKARQQSSYRARDNCDW